MSDRKRYAIVGVGSRSRMFSNAILKHFPEQAELVGICDNNPGRLTVARDEYQRDHQAAVIPMYAPEQFEQMIAEQQVDTVIVTTVDRLHHHYICRAMEAGCDAISEKPMTTDAEKAQEILDTIERTGKELRVTFNYRYAPRNTRVKELLKSGVIGKVHSVHFEWLLDTKHGADYFRRWHRDKRNSGGLMVHKATHHFDLVNWWLEDAPKTVMGMGQLAFYGIENAEARGGHKPYFRGTGNDTDCPFALDMSEDGGLKHLYLQNEHHDGYIRDRNVFGDGISIEDDMSVMVGYHGGTTMTYHLTAYSPWEGWRIAFNGDKGRLEYDCRENTYVSGKDDDHNRPDVRDAEHLEVREPSQVRVYPHFEPAYKIDVPNGDGGGHGGGDIRLLRDIFVGVEDDSLGHAADHQDGVRSILTGIAANKSFETGMPVQVATLVDHKL